MTNSLPKSKSSRKKKGAEIISPPSFLPEEHLASVSSPPKIYVPQEHLIDPSLLDAHALDVIHQLRSYGHQAYIVGGSLRDLLCGKQPKDFDISTSATPEEVKQVFRRQCILIGRRFRLAHIRYGKKVIEVATFRSGETGDDQLILRDNNWGTLEEDIARRDFTINAFCYDPLTQELIDYVEGFQDLKKETLRVIGDPALRFRQDPVRMLRLLKFQARLGFRPDAKSMAALEDNRDEILKSSPARILEELCKMLESGYSQPFFELMKNSGLLKLLQPQINHFLSHDSNQLLFSLLKAIDYFISHQHLQFDRPILVAALLYPLLEEKITKEFSSRDKIPHQGEIFHLVQELMSNTMRNTITFPAKMRHQTTNILEMQYRLCPLEGAPMRFKRLIQHPDAKYALQFLYIRSALDQNLCQVYAQWLKVWKEEKR
jgi:poly(A) polymerase